MSNSQVTLISLLCVVCLLVCLSNAEFKMAQHGKKCVEHNPFEPMKVCDYAKGLDCRGKSKDGTVCSCYGSFVWDKENKECRRKVGDICQASWDAEHEKKRPWNEKCQQGAICGDKGICECKKGSIPFSKWGSTCVKPLYVRGQPKSKPNNYYNYN